MMAKLPERPFLTRDFSPAGGGIDYLGMRWVSLTMLGERLVPGINNQTGDFGIYCLATWIAWKFARICESSNDYVFSNFRRFEERVGVAISHTLRSDSPSTEKFGEAYRKIGVQQKLQLPCELSFDAASRTRSTSIFAAALYGPSLRYLNLISGEAIAADGTSTKIPVASDDAGTRLIVETVDRQLSQSDAMPKMAVLDNKVVTHANVDDLGLHGLNPSFYRYCSQRVKRGFLKKLIPTDTPNGRTLTARLLIAAIEQTPGLTLEDVRRVWHTGLFPNGETFGPDDQDLTIHREQWAIFQCRQYQRYVVELFMKCFELALDEGYTSMDSIADFVQVGIAERSDAPESVRDIIENEAKLVSQARQLKRVSETWNKHVHGDHDAYEYIPPEDEDDDCRRALRMMARWWLRTAICLDSERHQDLIDLGGEERMSIRWFFIWVEQRLDLNLTEFLQDVFEQLVFGQHIRVALSRFDGKSQRLRFVLSDEGIVPTRSAAGKMGESLPGWTDDRLSTLGSLLTDLSVIQEDDEGGLSVGDLVAEVF